MSGYAIFGPVFALAAWTVAILLRVAFARFAAVRRREASVAGFRYGEPPDAPAWLLLPSRNYMNLLELPVLFYVICVVAFAAGVVGMPLLVLAWVYFALRVAHSLVHVLYNNVMHRFAVFAASNFVLLAMWIVAGIAILAKQ